MLLEKAFGAYKHILYTHGIITGETLSSPLIQWIDLVASKVIGLRSQHPLDDAVIDWDTQKLTKYLAQKDGTGRDMHVMPNLLILQHILGPIPVKFISLDALHEMSLCNRTIYLRQLNRMR